jgi:hypothetical protein
VLDRTERAATRLFGTVDDAVAAARAAPTPGAGPARTPPPA